MKKEKSYKIFKIIVLKKCVESGVQVKVIKSYEARIDKFDCCLESHKYILLK